MAGQLNIEKKLVENSAKIINPIEKDNVNSNLEAERPAAKLTSESKASEIASISAKPAAQNNSLTNSTDEKKRAEAIDAVLEEGLNEIFLKMDASRQKEFKKKGEETVAQINKLLSETKIKVNKIIDLIRQWLKFIPGINKFFLEQEAKIKADKIIKVKNKY